MSSRSLVPGIASLPGVTYALAEMITFGTMTLEAVVWTITHAVVLGGVPALVAVYAQRTRASHRGRSVAVPASAFRVRDPLELGAAADSPPIRRRMKVRLQ